MKLGFLGVGRMGSPMALNLLEAGWDVTVFDPGAGDTTQLTDAGATVASTLRQLGDTDVTISMLPDADTTTETLRRLQPYLAPGHIHIAMGTIGITGARAAAAVVEQAGGQFVDAPVSGHVPLAKTGHLGTMVGTDPVIFETIKPILAAMTSVQSHVGAVGAGAALKLAVNIILCATNQAIAEALVFAEAHGVSPQAAYDFFGSSVIASPYLDSKREEFLHPGEQPVTSVMSALDKDLTLVLDAAGPSRVFLPATAAIRQVLVAASGLGLGETNVSRVIDVIRQLSAEP
jgi:3-hydroxyisobutyrate dehydrogenase-like beta-hydroxyacid dehydrogenase